jgi:hypothetical protein
MRKGVFMSSLCGISVYSQVHNLRINKATYTHIHSLKSIQSFSTFLFAVYTLLTHRVLHMFFVQLTPVKIPLSPSSTGPTITTT